MKFSILVPVYNVVQFLDECIMSIINQTYNNWEMILINDGSTDGSLELLQKYQVIDKRIRFYSQDNIGLLATRRKLLTYAKGDYCVFMDSDDYILDNNFLFEINDILVKSKPDLVIYKLARVDAKGGFINQSNYNLQTNINYEIVDNGELYTTLLTTDNLNNLVCKIVSTQILALDNFEYNNVKGLKHAEDLLQSASIIYNSKKAVFINKAYYAYRQFSGGISKQIDSSYFIDTSIVRGVLFNMFIQSNMVDMNTRSKFFENYINNIFMKYVECIKLNVSTQEIINIINKQFLFNISNKNIKKIKIKIKYYLLKMKSYWLIKILYNKLK